MRWLALASVLLAPLLTGCVSCDDTREIPLDRDLSPGDHAHLLQRVPERGGGEVMECSVGLPFLFVPLILSTREAEADLVGEDAAGAPRYELTAESFRALGLWLVQSRRKAKFDPDGRRFRASRSTSVLFRCLDFESGVERDEDGDRVETSETDLLWGLLWHRWTHGEASGGRLLFLPFGDERP